MALDSKQFQQIYNAIVAGYDEAGLRRMVRFEMGEGLDQITKPGALNDRVFDLVEWVNRTGRERELVQAAHKGNPTNTALKALYDAWFPPEAPADKAPAVAIDSTSPQIFLSYSRKDSEAVQQLLAALAGVGLSAWTDEGLEPGSPRWQSEIEKAIQRTECMVVLLSPNAKQSEWVSIEVSYAQELGRRVFPLLVRGNRTDAILLSLFNTQYVDARQDYAGAISSRLLPALRRYLNLVGTAPSERATEGETGQAVQVTEELHEAEPHPVVEKPAPPKPTVRASKPAIEFDLATIQAGKFTLSKDAGGGTVNLAAFRISRQPVTNAQYKAFVDATGQGEAPKGDAGRPVVEVNWNDASAFCKWASEGMGQTVRLPTEAEWEKAMAVLGIKDTDTWEWTGTKDEEERWYVVKRMKQGSVARYWHRPLRWLCWGFRVVVVPISR